MLVVDSADRWLEPCVESGKTEMFRVARLVDGIVACDPGVRAVAGGDGGPEPDGPVLVVFVVPEGGV